MNTALSDTILYVTGKQGIENTSQFELETMIAEYPYFVPAQLAYATKLKSENSFKLQTQVQKTGLFFNNFKWLQYQLMEVGANSFKSFSSKDYAIIEEKIVEQSSLKNNVIEAALPIAATPLQAIETPEIVETNTASSETEKPFDFMSNMSIPTVEDVKDLMNGIDDGKEVSEDLVEPIAVEISEPVVNEIAVQSEVVKDAVEPSIEEISEPIANEIEEQVVEASNTVEHIATENVSSFTAITNDEVLQNEPLESVNDIHAEIAALKANWYSQQQEAAVVSEVPEVVKEEVVVPEPEKQIFPGVSADIASFKNEWNKPASELATQSLPFETEPYYTIDYFASQGIKFDYSKAPHDKLTSKMLRFTDWLKKMKTVKPEQEIISEDPELDSAIQNIASMSNQTKEVVTETMAEIFAKQGKTEKAIQLYIKLSFLIPDKSAYFATQIKELKGI